MLFMALRLIKILCNRNAFYIYYLPSIRRSCQTFMFMSTQFKKTRQRCNRGCFFPYHLQLTHSIFTSSSAMEVPFWFSSSTREWLPLSDFACDLTHPMTATRGRFWPMAILHRVSASTSAHRRISNPWSSSPASDWYSRWTCMHFSRSTLTLCVVQSQLSCCFDPCQWFAGEKCRVPRKTCSDDSRWDWA